MSKKQEEATIEDVADKDVIDKDDGGAVTVPGRALIDLPAHDLKCGEFGTLPAAAAVALAAAGAFDPQAVADA